jgi:hypothetical protein
MSAPPSIMQGLFNGLDNSAYSPTLGLALGLLNAGGPSRMPISLGQALGQGFGTAQQFNQAGIQNQMQRMMLPYQRAKINWMLGDNSNQLAQGSQPSQQAPQSQAQPADNSLTDPNWSANVMNQAAYGQPQSAQPANPASTGLNAPATTSDPYQDPIYMHWVQGAAMGIPGADQLAAQRLQILTTDNPELQGRLAAAKSNATLRNDMLQNAVRYAGRPITVSPGATVFSQLPDLLKMIEGIPGGMGTTGAPGAPQVSAPGAPSPMTGPNAAKLPPWNPVGVIPLASGLNLGTAAGLKTTGDEATQQLNAAVKGQGDAQQQIAQLGELQASLNQLDTGPGKEAQLAVKNGLASFAHFFGASVPFNGDLTNAQAARKSIVNFTAQLVRGLGAREPAQVVQFINKGMQSLNNPQDANDVLTGMMRGAAEYKDAMGRFAQQWSQKYGSGYAPGVGTFQGAWQKNADPTAFMMNSLPAFEQQQIIEAAKTNTTLRVELQRAAQSAKWLQQNGFMQQQGSL